MQIIERNLETFKFTIPQSRSTQGKRPLYHLLILSFMITFVHHYRQFANRSDPVPQSPYADIALHRRYPLRYSKYLALGGLRGYCTQPLLGAESGSTAASFRERVSQIENGLLALLRKTRMQTITVELPAKRQRS